MPADIKVAEFYGNDRDYSIMKTPGAADYQVHIVTHTGDLVGVCSANSLSGAAEMATIAMKVDWHPPLDRW